MIQIFICSTPYHVMLSHLSLEAISSDCQHDKSTKLLILTEHAVSSKIIDIIDNTFWDNVLMLPFYDSLKFYTIKEHIDNWILENNLSKSNDKVEIFINDDKRWRNQLLITGIKPDKISLVEDGMGAYLKGKVIFREKIYRGLLLKFIFKDRLINTSVISNIAADRVFALRETAYSWFGPDRKLILLNYQGSKYIDKITKKNSIQKEIFKSNTAQLIILTSPIVESGSLTASKEWKAWEKALSLLPKYSILAVKPHPREKEYYFKKRLEILYKAFKNSKIIQLDSNLPAELLFCNKNLKSEIFSPDSTLLANLKSIRPDLTIYHGVEIFSSNKRHRKNRKRLAEYYNKLGIQSLKTY